MCCVAGIVSGKGSRCGIGLTHNNQECVETLACLMGRLSCCSICHIHFVLLNFTTRIKLVCGWSRKICALVRLGELPILSSLKSNTIERQSERFYVTKLPIGCIASVVDE